MSIQTELTRLTNGKNAIVSAIEGKGVDVPSGAKLDALAALVEAIPPQSGVQPDWNQNDTTQPDYIKSRPFYAGDPVETVLLEETTATFSVQDGFYMAAISADFLPEIGTTYKVSWDGTIYECVGTDYNGSSVVFGNLSIVDSSDANTGEPFVFVKPDGPLIVIPNSTEMEHVFSISGPVIVIHKIPSKYVDVLDKFIVHDNATITLNEANNYAKKFYTGAATHFVWCGNIFDSLNRYGSDKLLFYRNNTKIVVAQNSDGVFSIEDLSEEEIRFGLTSGGIATAHILSIVKGESVKIEPRSNFAGSCTSDTLLKVKKNGITLGQDMEVLGDGTVKAYSIILPSSTTDSTKKFKITVDDSGTITATEVT